MYNEKSLKPLAQIVLGDHEGEIFVRVKNNGLGPLMVQKITFTKDGKHFGNIEECLDLNPKTYMHIAEIESSKKIILPGAFLEIFHKQFADMAAESEMDLVRHKLAQITLKVIGQDIYDNKMTIERDFQWFERHSIHKGKHI